MDEQLLLFVMLVVKTSLLLFVGVFVARVLKRSSAALRHSLGTIVLASVVLLPLLSLTLPHWSLEWPRGWIPFPSSPSELSEETKIVSTANRAEGPITVQRWNPTEVPAASRPSRVVDDLVAHSALEKEVSTAIAVTEEADSSQNAPAKSLSPFFDGVESSSRGETDLGDRAVSSRADSGASWVQILAGLWLFGAAMTLLMWISAKCSIVRLTRRATPIVAADWNALLADSQRRFGIARPVCLLRSHENVIPMTWGVFRPRILLPLESDTWNSEQRQMVLLHELAHIRRWDGLALWLSQVATVLHWYHPLVWLACRRQRFDREGATDEVVIEQGIAPDRYATALLEVARVLHPVRRTAVLAAPMAQPSTIEKRLRMILAARTNSSASSFQRRWGLSLLALLLLVPFALLSLAASNQSVGEATPLSETESTASTNSKESVGSPGVGDSDLPKSASPEALRKKISVEFGSTSEEDDFSLEEAIDHLRELTGLNFHVFWRSLAEDYDITPWANVNLKLHDVPAEVVIRLLLSTLDDELGYHYQNGIVLIGAKDLLANRYVDRAIPKSDRSPASAKTVEALQTFKLDDVHFDSSEQELASFVDELRERTGLNFLVHWSLSEQFREEDLIRLDLKDVRFDHVLDLLLESGSWIGHTYIVDSGVIVFREREYVEAFDGEELAKALPQKRYDLVIRQEGEILSSPSLLVVDGEEAELTLEGGGLGEGKLLRFHAKVDRLGSIVLKVVTEVGETSHPLPVGKTVTFAAPGHGEYEISSEVSAIR